MATPSSAENTTKAGNHHGRGNLVVTWTVATAAGLAAVAILGFILTMGLFAAWSNSSGGGFVALIVGELLGIAVGGILIGGAQAWVLVHLDTATGWTRHAGGRWTASTACGWIIGLAGGYATLSLISRLAPQEWGSAPVTLAATLVALATAGALLGLAQWLVLRTHVAHAGIWVAFSAAGTMSGGVLISAVLQMLTGYGTPLLSGSVVASLLAEAIGGAALGVVTGLTLATLLNVPASRPHLST
jgi:hypothetical protein